MLILYPWWNNSRIVIEAVSLYALFHIQMFLVV